MRLLLVLLQYLPRRVATALMCLVAWLAWALGLRRRFALENLAIAFPEKSEAERRALGRANYLHLGRSGADFLRSPAASDEEVFSLVEPADWEKIEPLVKARQGFIVATAHLGNFELFGVYAARRGLPVTVLTRELKGRANAQWIATRALAGIREIHRGMDNLVESVRRGEALALLIDQNMLPRRAIFVPFFGRLAATTPAPAKVAERTGAPVFLGAMLRKSDGTYRTFFEGPFHFEPGADRDRAIREFTELLNVRLEKLIREHPEQWFWMHRRWKTRPPQEAAAETPAAPAVAEAG